MVNDSGWDRYRITETILSIADKLHRIELQQLSQLARVLERADPAEVFEGLYAVFAFGSDDEYQHFIEQEYAGALLLHLRPPCPRTLEDVLVTLLDRWNFSVEQLPIYLAYAFGPTEWDRCLSDLERHSPSRAVEVLRWWTSGMGKDALRELVEMTRWIDTSIR